MVNHPKNGCHFQGNLYTSFHSKSGENMEKVEFYAYAVVYTMALVVMVLDLFFWRAI